MSLNWTDRRSTQMAPENRELPPNGRTNGMLTSAVVFSAVLLSTAMLPIATQRTTRADDPGAETVAGESQDWPFNSPRRPTLPEVLRPSWIRNPIDVFILSQLEQENVSPSEPADRRTLIRRVYFDVLGLPPTPQEVERVLTDPTPDAYERLINRLLANPHHGERWAQHWLDVVRYADSDGFEYDDPRPHAWRYRDWVITALNDDKPFDRFVREQIAADELFPNDRQALAALGLHRLGPLRLNAGIQDEVKNRQEVLTEIVDGVGAAFLGMTFGCARCHDHKFDPIPQADYFRLQAFFAGTQAVDVPLVPQAQQDAFNKRQQDWQAGRDKLANAIKKIELPYRDRLLAAKELLLTGEARAARKVAGDRRTARQQRLVAESNVIVTVTPLEIANDLDAVDRRQIAELHRQMQHQLLNRPQPIPSLMVVLDPDRQTPKTHILDRGEPHRHLESVTPTFPAAFVAKDRSTRPAIRRRPTGIVTKSADSTGRRAALAEWLVDASHPLTARVFVNRIWQHHFGWGIVATPNDFGAMGEQASHPDLLDWLTVEFIEHDWSVKHLHRLMLTSATYRQSSQANAVTKQADPDNRLLSRMNRRRLEAEVLRDSILSVAGSLNRSIGGPGVRLPLPPEIAALQYKGSWTPDADPFCHVRRTVYLFVKRNNRPPLLEAFDAPSTTVPCGRRSESNHAGQALALLNSPLVARQARRFARRLITETNGAINEITERGYQLAIARPPRDEERRLAERFFQRAAADRANRGVPGGQSAFADAVTVFCLVLMNLDEFLYVD